MNNFEKHGFDDDNFGAKGSIVSAFDAFRKSCQFNVYSPQSAVHSRGRQLRKYC